MVDTVISYARANQERFVRELQELCRQPSIAAQNIGVKETSEMVARMMEEVSVKAEIIPIPGGQPVVYGFLDAGAARTILFYDHYDVQPPEPLDEWDSPPFGAEIRNGYLYARGVSDNKGNIVARLKAIESYMKTVGKLPVNIKFAVEGEEEIGSPNFHHFVEKHKQMLKADGVIWESGSIDAGGRLGITFGNKGICYIELRAKGANQDLHSSRAAIVPNPAWRLVKALDAMKDLATDKCLVEGFYDDVLAPTEKELEMMRNNPMEETRTLKDIGLDRFMNGLTGIELQKKLLYQPTCTICGLLSGYTGMGTKTVLPKSAMAKIDMRLVPNQTGDSIYQKVKTHLAKKGFGDIEVVLLSSEDPGQSDLNDPFIPVVVETAKETYGTEPFLAPRSAGSGPMFLFNRIVGVATISGVGVGHSNSRAHAPNESIKVEHYHKNIEHLIRIMDRFGNTK